MYVATPETLIGPEVEEQLVTPVTPVRLHVPDPVGTSALTVPVTCAVNVI